MKTTQEKYNDLKEYLRSLGSVAVAFSSGVDSTFLLRVAHDVLGDRAIAVTAVSCSFPERERKEAQKFCEENHIRQVLCQSEELDIDGFRSNPKNRCYLCKHELFEKILKIAEENGIAAVAEGSNMDDNGDYRPGLMAVKELGIKSPLRHAELTKAEIRELSKELGLPTWDKQSFACLASRFVYTCCFRPALLHGRSIPVFRFHSTFIVLLLRILCSISFSILIKVNYITDSFSQQYINGKLSPCTLLQKFME